MDGSQQNQWNILYVEDDREDYLIVRQMLARANGHAINVEWAATYEEGRARIQAGAYDAYLVDFDLGGRTGIDFIRELHESTQAPFILYTAHDSRAIDLEAQQAGATLFLTKKDAKPLLLERVIRYAIERKLAERRLDESQQRFQQIFQMSPDAVYVQVDEKFAFLNLAALRLFGAERMEQIVGRPVLDFIHPQDRAVVARRMQHTNRALQPVPQRDLLLLRLDGARVEVEAVASPIQFEGRPGALVIARDIRARKRDEANAALAAAVADDFARLSSQEEILQAVGEKIYRHFGLTRLVFAHVDEAAGTINTVYDRRAPDLPGVSGELRISDFLDEAQLDEIKTGRLVVVNDLAADPRTAAKAANYQAYGIMAQMLAPLVISGAWHSLIALHKNTPYAWRPDEIELLDELAPRIYSFLERARAEESLRLSEARYRTLYESMDEGFLLSEVIYDQQGKPVDLLYYQGNPAAGRILGMDFCGRRLSEINPGFDRQWPAVNARVARTGVGERWEVYLNLLQTWHSFYLFPVDGPSSAVVACLFRDITERKRSEAIMAEDLRATRLLQDLGARLVSEENLDVLYQQILAAAVALTQADSGSVQILDEANQALLLLAAQGLDPEMIARLAWVEAGYQTSCGLALDSGQRTWVDFDDLARPDPQGDLRAHVEAGLLSAQSTPLTSRSGRLIGMITTHWRQHHRLSEHGLRYLDLLARQAADLIEQKLMEEALRHSRTALEEDLAGATQLQQISTQLMHEDRPEALYGHLVQAAMALMRSDMGSLQVLDPESGALRLAAWHGFAAQSAAFWASVPAGAHTACRLALDQQERVIVQDVETWEFAAGTPDLEHFRLSGIRAIQSTPLRARSGQLLGVISTNWATVHRPSPRELRLFDALARQAADLIESQAAAAALQAGARRNAFRLRLSDALRPLNDPDEIKATAARLLGEHLQASRVHYADVDADENSLDIQADYCRPGLASIAGAYRLDSFGAHFLHVLRKGRTLAAPDVDRLAHLAPGKREIYAAWQARAYVAAPLVRDGHLRALFSVNQDQPRAWSADELALIDETAERAWAAVERAQADAAARRYAQELERSNQALQEFASIASHDMQEPLRKIQAFGELLSTRFSAELGEEGQGYLVRMTSAAARMSHMLRGLLDYSRVTSRGQPFAAVELNTVAAEVLSDLEARLLETGGQVKVGDLPVIQADALQMRQLLQNLIGNALKYHRPGVPPLVTVSCQANGSSQVALRVQDNGVGFDMQDAGRLLDPFVRLHPRSQYEGSGMGLAICKKIVERHGGRLEFESAPEQGATFMVVLPR